MPGARRRHFPTRGDWEIVAAGLGQRPKQQQPVSRSISLSDCTSTTSTPAPSNAFGGAGGLSGDGGTMACSLDAGLRTPLHACTISSTQGVTDLGALDAAQAGTLSSFGFGANTDGSVVVGAADTDASGNQHALGWTRDAGMVDLGAASGASGMSRPLAVSGDGSVVVGESTFPSGLRRAFIWTEATGFQDVDPAGFGSATAISADGLVIVGSN